MACQTGLIGLQAIESDSVRAGLDYWRRIKGSRAYPSRRHVIPRELNGLLRHAILLEVINGGDEFEYRIFGDAHVQITGCNMQGSQLRDVARLMPSLASDLRKLYNRVVQTGAPLAVRAFRDDVPGCSPIASEHVLLPVGRDARNVDHILVFSVYKTVDLPLEQAAC